MSIRLSNLLSPYPFHSLILPSLDAFTFLGWGLLLLKYWLTNEIRLLIHPNYIGLVIVTGIILLLLGVLKVFQLYQARKRIKKEQETVVQHITLFPVGWSTFLLLGTAILGLLIPPTILGSEAALQRGIRETLPLTQTQPERFRVKVNPEERSLIDWIKTINAYPEPEAYEREKVKVKGFVIRKKALPENYFLLAQFIITCCAIDAYPVALPVKLEAANSNYSADTWLEIEGEMITETLSMEGRQDEGINQSRQVVIQAKKISKIPTPRNPYGY